MYKKFMKKVLLALLPSILALLYGAVQLIVHATTGHVYFSSVFAWESVTYLTLGLVYIFFIFRGARSMLRVAIYGSIIGGIVFFALGSMIFLKFGTFFECEEYNVSEKLSFDRKYIAREYSENCGAVSDYETIFEVENLVSKENQQVLNLKGELVDECESSWVDAKALLIECIGKRHVQIYNFKDKFEDIQVNFRLPDSFFMYDHPKPGQETNLVK